MYINDSNLFIEISNMTNILVLTNARLRQKIADGVWEFADESLMDNEKWEWDPVLLTEIMVFIKNEHPEMKFTDENSPQKIMMDHVTEFFTLMKKLNENPLTR